MNNHFVFLFFVLIFTFSCSPKQKSNEEIIRQIEKDTKLIIPDYLSITVEKDEGFSPDYSHIYTIMFDSVNFKYITDQINVFIENDSVVQAYNNEDIKWESHGFGYKLTIVNDTTGDLFIYSVFLERQTLKYLYINE